MHSEHLQNVRPVILIAAWLVAFAVTSLIMLALLGLNLVDADAPSTRSAMAAMAFGFFAGGVFAGLRARQAPILYGIALGIMSLVVWFALNLLSGALFDGDSWQAVTTELSVSVLLVQIVAAVLGARVAYRWVMRGQSETAI